MIVFDSSTMILLAKTDMLEMFISNYHDRIIIPEKVRAEICKKGSEETPFIKKLINEKKIDVIKVKKKPQIKKLIEDFNIDAGEAEVLILSIQEGANTIATDDRNAIRACKMLKINFISAIAFLIRAFQKGFINKEQTLLKLQKLQSCGRYSRAILEDAAKKIKGGV